MPKLETLPGSDILFRHWNVSSPQAILILIHGLGAHSERWNALAEFFSQKGIASFAIELKGFGETKDLPGHIDSFETYYKDIRKLTDEAKKLYPGKKVFALAESMGALIAYVMAAQNPKTFDGLVLISPAFKNAMPFPFSSYLKLMVFLLRDHKGSIPIPFTSAMCTRDTAYQEKMNADPRELRSISVKTLLNIVLAQRQAAGAVKKILSPTLFLLAGKDYLVNAKEAKKVFHKMPLQEKVLIEYPEMLHALSIELNKEKVFEDILNWLTKRI